MYLACAAGNDSVSYIMRQWLCRPKDIRHALAGVIGYIECYKETYCSTKRWLDTMSVFELSRERKDGARVSNESEEKRSKNKTVRMLGGKRVPSNGYSMCIIKLEMVLKSF
jgi:hypothetical protein